MRAKGLLVCALAVTIGVSGAAAGNGALAGSVGPGFTIRLAGGDGLPVRNLDPGTYVLAIDDRTEDHNFHLSGPGVDVATEVDTVGASSFTVTLRDGRYQFVCDVHPATMRGSFDVGAGPPPPPAVPKLRRLTAIAGPGATIALRTATGARVRTLAHGPYLVTVRDLSARQNVHLRGAGVNRRTGRAQKGTFTWRLTLRAGTLVYLSDASPARVRGSVPVR